MELSCSAPEKKYQVFNTEPGKQVSYFKAKEACESIDKDGLKGSLAKIATSADNVLYRQTVDATGYKGSAWIGVTDEHSEGTWVWDLDGSALSYSSWNGGEPNNWGHSASCDEDGSCTRSGEHCAEMYGTGKWCATAP